LRQPRDQRTLARVAAYQQRQGEEQRWQEKGERPWLQRHKDRRGRYCCGQQ
jgi:hypothetical protein